MSTTMPWASSSSARNATRMTNVAPCTFWAGPKTSPRKEWAIMIWSETSTAYTGIPLRQCFIGRRVADQRADRVRVGTQNRGQFCRQLLEGHSGREQCIERRLVEERKRRREAPLTRPTRAMCRRDRADLARYQPQPPTVERLPQRRRDVPASVPTQLDDGSLLARKPQRGGETAGRAARVKDDIAIARRALGRGKASADRVREFGARGGDIDHRHLRRRQARA